MPMAALSGSPFLFPLYISPLVVELNILIISHLRGCLVEKVLVEDFVML